MIRIAVDAMGGDNAPQEVIRGVLQAEQDNLAEMTLVGPPEIIEDTFRRLHRKRSHTLKIHPATQVIQMDESPVAAVKQKKDSSMNVTMKLLKEGKVDGVVTAGNTGAFVASALFTLGRIPGIDRPAVVAFWPVQDREILMLDVGATVDCKPRHLLQFAAMGVVYAERMMHIPNPRLGLLNVGAEPDKGNELTQATFPLLQKASFNFVGNVESFHMVDHKVDVVVCDGFVGNLILKFMEAVAMTLYKNLRKELTSHPIARFGIPFIAPAFQGIRKKIDFEEKGGSILLGVNGVCVKTHGRARAKGIRNAVRLATEAVQEKLPEKIREASRLLPLDGV